MPTLSAGASTAVTVAIGTYLNGTGAGQAVIGPAGVVDPLTAGDAWQIGPFDRATSVSLTAISAMAYEVKDVMQAPSLADRLSNATVGAIQGVVSRAGILANTTALVGDSRNANNSTATQTQQQGYFTNMNALLGDRFQVVGRFAFAGKKLAEVLVEQIPQVLALNPRPQYVFMECGHNDIAPGLGNRTGDQAIADWLQIYDALNAAGIILLQSTSLPSNLITTPSALTHLHRYNQYLMQQSGVRGGFFCFDGHAAAVDPATGQYLAARTADSVHSNYEGAWCVARLGFAAFDPLIPKIPRLNTSPSNYRQLAINPTGNGSGGAPVTMTGSIPNNWAGGIGGTCAVAASKVARTDGRTGEFTRLTFGVTGNTAADLAFLEVGRPQIQNWAANTAVTANWRIRPTTPNGRHYLVTTGGTSANAADPSASWSTTIGATVVDGGATMTVVEAIDVGDTVEMVAEILAANFNGAPGTIRLSLAFYTVATALISTVFGNYADATYTIPSSAGGAQTLRTLSAVIPATTGKIIARVQVIAQNGAVVDVGNIEIQKR